nr:hypothetical protein [uncultured Sphaerochaeta sp.]
MKKTIAILLVLVIAMAGVWAANNSTSDMKITTTIADIFQIFVTEDNTAITDWDEYVQADVIKDVTSSFADAFSYVASLQARSNRVAGFNIKVKASSLYSTTADKLIKYEVKIGSTGAAVASDATIEGGYTADLSAVTSTLSATVTGTGSMVTINEDILVKLDSTDYANAGAANDYDAKIYIEYSTT